MPICMPIRLLMYVIYGIMCNCFDFRDCGLSIEHVVAHSFLFSFSPSVKALAAIDFLLFFALLRGATKF